MTNQMNKWIKTKRAELLEEFGGSCRICGTSKELQFAHLTPTDLKGWGRGRKERYYDVKNNPDSYTLLCEPCHKQLDRILETKGVNR